MYGILTYEYSESIGLMTTVNISPKTQRSSYRFISYTL